MGIYKGPFSTHGPLAGYKRAIVLTFARVCTILAKAFVSALSC